MQVLFNEHRIKGAIGSIALDLNDRFLPAISIRNPDVVISPVLEGGMLFAVELMRHLKFNFKVASVKTRSYDGQEANEVELVGGIPMFGDTPAWQGQDVLLLDDVYDRGETLHYLKERAYASGARSVTCAVLVAKGPRHEQPDDLIVGLRANKTDWLVGYGMDDNGYSRQLREIYVKTDQD